MQPRKPLGTVIVVKASILRSLARSLAPALCACHEAQAPDRGELSNPIAPVLVDEAPALSSAGLDSADPFLFVWDGRYWLTHTAQTRVVLRSADTLGGLATAPVEEIWRPGDGGSPAAYAHDVWAPEFHRLDGPNGPRWYVYVTADPGDLNDHRLLVLESAADDPRGPYTFKALLDTGGYAIDATVGAVGGRLYLLYAGRLESGSVAEGLYLAELSDPWTLGTTPMQISQPEYPWEQSLVAVNEGPELLVHGASLHVIFSADGCLGAAYKLGRLTVPLDADLLDPSTWAHAKSPTPVFERSDEAGVYGPGHGSFFQSPDGTEDWQVYHATTGEGLTCIGGLPRVTRAQPFTWNADDTPNFGEPLALATPLSPPSGDTTLTRQLEQAGPIEALGGTQHIVDDPRYLGGSASAFLADAAGGEVSYSIDVPRSGAYRLLVRRDVGPAEATVQLTVNGRPTPQPTAEGFRETAGAVEADFGDVTLEAGPNRLTFAVAETSGGGKSFIADQVRLR
jgi:GH43 family beta-xylosidase